MLVLTRKIGEGILIGDEVIVKIIEIKGGNVRVGIEAPRDRKIYRQEVYDRIGEENRGAAQWSAQDLEDISLTLSTNKGNK